MTRGDRRAESRPAAFEVGLRRVTELDPDAPLPESDERLVALVGDEIRARGPMTFSRFMELALYEPASGYYTRPAALSAGPGSSGPGSSGPGRGGDFLTAPEGHPIFGWSVARHLESAWVALDRPGEFVIREHGAGSGALAAGILDGLRRSESALLEAIRYQAIDVAPARTEALHERLAAMGLSGYLVPPDDRPAAGAILANELLDALPVHLVEGGPDGTLLERFVVLDDGASGRGRAQPAVTGVRGTAGAETSRFTTTVAPPSTPALQARLAAEQAHLEAGQPAEICLALDDWVARAAAPLERGVMLLIDYGHPAEQLYRRQRGSTLRAYHRHRVHADPFVAIGRQDLTTHVDLTAVERAAAAAGLGALGRTTQAELLSNLGAGELLVALQTDPATTLESYLEARAALVRMLDPRATGAFAVLAFGRGIADGVRVRGLP